MALVKCSKCGHEISDKAEVCPKCGNRIATSNGNGNSIIKIVGLIAVAALLIGGTFFFLNKGNEADIVKSTVNEMTSSEIPSFDRNKAILLKVVSVEYGSSLAAQGGNTYEAKNLCDGDTTTAWAVNLDSEGIYDSDQLYGPIFNLNCKKLSHIIIRNGYGKSADAFKNNTRAAKVRFLSLVDDEDGDDERVLYDGSLRDKSTPQRLEIPLDLADNNDIRQIRMNFNTQLNGGYYMGDKWNDLCITEVEFWGFE